MFEKLKFNINYQISFIEICHIPLLDRIKQTYFPEVSNGTKVNYNYNLNKFLPFVFISKEVSYFNPEFDQTFNREIQLSDICQTYET